jgi:hypothetical protein
MISKWEEELQNMTKEMENPVVASDANYIQQYQKKQRELEQKVYEWELLSEELEELNSQN